MESGTSRWTAKRHSTVTDNSWSSSDWEAISERVQPLQRCSCCMSPWSKQPIHLEKRLILTRWVSLLRTLWFAVGLSIRLQGCSRYPTTAKVTLRLGYFPSVVFAITLMVSLHWCTHLSIERVESIKKHISDILLSSPCARGHNRTHDPFGLTPKNARQATYRTYTSCYPCRVHMCKRSCIWWILPIFLGWAC